MMLHASPKTLPIARKWSETTAFLVRTRITAAICVNEFMNAENGKWQKHLPSMGPLYSQAFKHIQTCLALEKRHYVKINMFISNV